MLMNHTFEEGIFKSNNILLGYGLIALGFGITVLVLLEWLVVGEVGYEIEKLSTNYKYHLYYDKTQLDGYGKTY